MWHQPIFVNRASNQYDPWEWAGVGKIFTLSNSDSDTNFRRKRLRNNSDPFILRTTPKLPNHQRCDESLSTEFPKQYTSLSRRWPLSSPYK